MQNIDPLSSEMVDFKYDMKMSTVNRQQFKTDEAEAVSKYFLALNEDYKEIIKPIDNIKKANEKSKSPKKIHVTDKMKGNFTKLKDIDFVNLHESLPIASSQASLWEMAQAKIIKDVKFLESINIMDYSLIITVARNGGSKALQEESKESVEPRRLYEEEKIPEIFAKLQRNGNCLLSPSGKFAYVFGIIDILQEYDIEKKGEGGLKGIFAKFSGKSDISCQPPNTYAERFLNKLGGIFRIEEKASILGSEDSFKIN